MAAQVKLRVRKLSPTRDAQEITATIADIVTAIEDGMFDAHLDVLDNAITVRIREYQQEEGDELERPVSDRMRKIRADRPFVVPVPGKHYRLWGTKYSGVVVVFLEVESGLNGSGGEVIALVEATKGNEKVEVGQKYRLPLRFLEEIPEVKKEKKPDTVQQTPYRSDKCRECGDPIDYSGRGRPRAVCNKCLVGPHNSAPRIAKI